MRRLLMAAIMLVPLTMPAFAEDTSDVKGVGATDCPNVIESLKAHPGGAGYVYSEWVNGLMSGANVIIVTLVKKPAKDLRSSTQESVIKGVVEFCKTHPDANLGDAAVHVWLSQPTAGS